jgi:hypothetical protein
MVNGNGLCIFLFSAIKIVISFSAIDYINLYSVLYTL